MGKSRFTGKLFQFRFEFTSVNGDIFNEFYDESGSSVEKTRIVDSK